MQDAQIAVPPAPQAPAPPDPQSLRDQIRATVEQQVQAARAQAAAAGVAAQDAEPAGTGPLTPTVIVRPGGFDGEIPPQAVDISLAFFAMLFAIIVGFPIARAIGRWIDRRGNQPRIPVDLTSQLNQIAQSVDAMAIEVERISEGQRFTTRLLAEQHATRSGLPAGREVPPA
ncbi:hypothetical protein BH23GEM2_BH23GEM2_02340 [soil metagenome]